MSGPVGFAQRDLENGRESQYCEFLEFLGRRGSTHELLGSGELLGPDTFQHACMVRVRGRSVAWSVVTVPVEPGYCTCTEYSGYSRTYRYSVLYERTKVRTPSASSRTRYCSRHIPFPLIRGKHSGA